MKLYLVQHGEATDKAIDPQRPLSEKGKSDVARVAASLAQAGIRIERVLHSGKTRARQTAEILAQKTAADTGIGVSDGIDPLDDVTAFDIRASCDHVDTMLVGHLPFMAKLVAYLVSGDAEVPLVAYQPGSVVCLESTDTANWQINWMLRPELLS